MSGLVVFTVKLPAHVREIDCHLHVLCRGKSWSNHARVIGDATGSGAPSSDATDGWMEAVKVLMGDISTVIF
eukprot:2176199-Rhodomonas_salina.1